MLLPLLPQHLADLRRSGIDDDQIAQCRFRSETDPAQIGQVLNRPRYQGELGPCLVIPYQRADGTTNGYCRLKPDQPRIGSGGKPIKYEAPIGHPNLPYFPPATVGVLADATMPLLITEGEKKAAKADQEGFPCIGISGVWSWQQARSRDRLGRPEGERKLIPDLDGLPWLDRQVYIAFDYPDYRDNPNVRKAEEALAAALTRKGAVARAIRLPGTGTDKVGLDDYLIAHSAADLSGLMAAAEVIEDPERDATVADLRKQLTAGAWLWPGWIPNAALTLLAADAGTGKTRFCFDLHRRMFHGDLWPDGTTINLPAGGKSLWVVADNQYQEMCDIPPEFKIPDDVVVINARAMDPFEGTSLQDRRDLRDFEDRIKRVQPAIVFIDTVTQTTDLKAQDVSEAKQQYKPLQEIALRCRVPIVCVTHTNQAGKVLGRRPGEKVRVVIQMACPDPDHGERLRLWVSKSKAVKPPPLGVTMGDDGNQYDTNPPPLANGVPGGGSAVPPRLQEIRKWLVEKLVSGPKRVGDIRKSAEQDGFNTMLLYRAKDSLHVEEFLVEGKKWWKLTTNSMGP